MSYNQIEHIDSTMFSNIPHLLSLSLRENKVYSEWVPKICKTIELCSNSISNILLTYFRIAYITTTQRFCWCTCTSNVGFVAQQKLKRRHFRNARFCKSIVTFVFRYHLYIYYPSYMILLYEYENLLAWLKCICYPNSWRRNGKSTRGPSTSSRSTKPWPSLEQLIKHLLWIHWTFIPAQASWSCRQSFYSSSCFLLETPSISKIFRCFMEPNPGFDQRKFCWIRKNSTTNYSKFTWFEKIRRRFFSSTYLSYKITHPGPWEFHSISISSLNN